MHLLGGGSVEDRINDLSCCALCAAGIAPAHCTQDNAIDVVAMGRAANELLCMQDSMMTLASLAIQAGPNEYWRVVCVSRTDCDYGRSE
jgi:hypothetical protein